MKLERGYARNGDVSLAYGIAGEGPPDLVFVPGIASHLDLLWENPFSRPFFERLASFSRLVMFDKRGTGLSDRHSIDTTLDVRMDDVRRVMDVAGVDRAVLAAHSEGGPQTMAFAATFPERVSSLILIGTAARWSAAPDYPGGAELEARMTAAAAALSRWGAGELISFLAPSLGRAPEVLEALGVVERSMATPSAVAAIGRWMLGIDVRGVLPTLAVPTLVIHRQGDRIIPDECAHYLRDHIPNVKYVEVPGPDHIPWVGDSGSMLDEIQEWVTGTRSTFPVDRVLATVLFSDIVDSTRLAAEMGDRRWRETLRRHDEVSTREIRRFGGRVVKQTGDGVFATFDGPARSVEAAKAISEAVRAIGMTVRVGVHTGEVEVRGDDLGGIAVHIGARVASKASPNEILVSSTVKDLVAGSGIRFEDRGSHELKGVPDSWRLYSVSA